GEQDKEGQITLLVIKERPSGRFFLCFGLSFSLQNHKICSLSNIFLAVMHLFQKHCVILQS
ncbi:MAG: hypothetical protein ACI4HQ_12150, partial [Acetatifactor sp.]